MAFPNRILSREIEDRQLFCPFPQGALLRFMYSLFKYDPIRRRHPVGSEKANPRGAVVDGFPYGGFQFFRH